MVMLVNAIASLKLLRWFAGYLAGDEIFTPIMLVIPYHLGKIANSSSQHGDADGCALKSF